MPPADWGAQCCGTVVNVFRTFGLAMPKTKPGEGPRFHFISAPPHTTLFSPRNKSLGCGTAHVLASPTYVTLVQVVGLGCADGVRMEVRIVALSIRTVRGRGAAVRSFSAYLKRRHVHLTTREETHHPMRPYPLCNSHELAGHEMSLSGS